MNSAIYSGQIWHRRNKGCQHTFCYPGFFLAVDLSELDLLDRSTSLFSARKFAIFSISERDYLRGVAGDTITKRVETLFSCNINGQNVQVPLDFPRPQPDYVRIVLLTVPKYFGYVFNPVNFFFCLDSNEKVVAILAEVNNTFGESHVYILTDHNAVRTGEYEFPKQLYVSPFFDVTGRYRLKLRHFEKKLSLSVKIYDDDSCVFSSYIMAVREPFCSKSLLGLLIRYPLYIWLTMVRIEYQALILLFKHKLPVFRKPAPTSYRENGIIEKIRLRLLYLLEKMR